MKENLPKRKHIRLKNYDYNSTGAYFITICAYKRQCLFAKAKHGSSLFFEDDQSSAFTLTEYGIIAKNQLKTLSERYSNVKIGGYAIMPNHIHAIIILEEAAGASPRPTLSDVICAYKSLTKRECNKIKPISKLFQNSFYDHVIRNEVDYSEVLKYIEENPAKWYYDKLYTEE